MPSPLYRRLNDESYLRYSPEDDEVTIVPADALPELNEIGGQDADELDTAQFDEQLRLSVVLVAMLTAVCSAHKHGNPANATDVLRTLTDCLHNKEALDRLYRIWDLLQQELEHVGDYPPRPQPTRAVNTNRAAQILRSICGGAMITRVHLGELAAGLPAVPLVDVRRARAIVAARGAKLLGKPDLFQALCDTLVRLAGSGASF